jgi:Domain of unknown function (DUF4442)
MTLPTSSMEYRKQILKPWKFWTMMFWKLPSIVFWGVKLKELDDYKCSVTIPYSFTTKNPFDSIYFGALNGAAELSTGLLVQMKLADYGPCSMLVTGFEAQFLKKSETIITFVCIGGQILDDFLKSLKNSGDKGSLELESKGYNSNNEVVCVMQIKWSIKKK